MNQAVPDFDDAAPPPADPQESAAEEAVIARFCSRCGAPLDPVTGTCLECTAPELPTAAPAASVAADTSAHRVSLGSALALYFVYLATFVPFVFMDEQHLATGELVVGVLDSLIVIVWVLVCWRSSVPLLARVGPGRAYAVAAGLSVFSVAFAFATVSPLAWLFDLPEYTYSEGFLAEGYGWWVVVLAVVVQPALIEELAFRGVIYNGLRTVMSTKETVVVSAMLFMVIHLNVLGFPYLFVMGVLLGTLRAWTGVLWPSVLLHALHNAAVIGYEAWSL